MVKNPVEEHQQPAAIASGKATGNRVPNIGMPADRIQPGADRLGLYLPLNKGKRVAVFANHTSTIGQQNLVGVLIKKSVKITVILSYLYRFSINDCPAIL